MTIDDMMSAVDSMIESGWDKEVAVAIVELKVYIASLSRRVTELERFTGIKEQP